ncbi:PAS domain-containing protein [Novosphingobium sp. FSY-8]|uniref:histidine kinase n=1 Tax=Novosphingobium ovatum TaxID=1908523 RepID=A0ABW9XC94_9SPHN|nr:ATP-binding protein [Novosphingobium ovatum]NBC36161.1 PAS domain-containing protein [Novosphingobium ovatum]
MTLPSAAPSIETPPRRGGRLTLLAVAFGVSGAMALALDYALAIGGWATQADDVPWRALVSFMPLLLAGLVMAARRDRLALLVGWMGGAVLALALRHADDPAGWVAMAVDGGTAVMALWLMRRFRGQEGFHPGLRVLAGMMASVCALAPVMPAIAAGVLLTQPWLMAWPVSQSDARAAMIRAADMAMLWYMAKAVALCVMAPWVWIVPAWHAIARSRPPLPEDVAQRLLGEMSEDMFLRTDRFGRITYASPATQVLLGWRPAELVGQRMADLAHPDEAALIANAIYCDDATVRLDHAAIAPRPDKVVCRLRRQDGRFGWMEWRFKLVGDGPTRGMAGIGRDVDRHIVPADLQQVIAAQTERRNAMFERAESLAKIGHWWQNLATGQMYWSSGLCRIYAMPPPESPSFELILAQIHPDDRDRVAALKHAAIADGQPWTYRARLVTHNGQERHVAGAGQPLVDEDGEVIEVFSVMLDITEEMHMQAALRAARDEARASAHAKSGFLAAMSHEIRTPMTGVLGMIDLLRHTDDADERARHLDCLDHSARLLRRVLDDVLDFSRLDGRADLAFEAIPFDMTEVVARTTQLYRQAALSKGLTLIRQPARMEPMPVVGDPLRMQQLLSNLIANAIKFTAQGHVIIRLRRLTRDESATRFRVEVRDTGIGIPADKQGAIFDAFTQADRSTTREYGGTGLGLAICRRLVERMEGRIGVESLPGQGATFWFEVALPTARPEPATTAATPAPTPAPPPNCRPLHILLAEDNAVNRSLLCTLLTREGHHVTTVTDGQAAVAAAAAPYDLICMDVQMPILDGPSATRAIRQSDGPCARVPIIALTADITHYQSASDLGFSAVLTKPIDTNALISCIAALSGGNAPISPWSKASAYPVPRPAVAQRRGQAPTNDTPPADRGAMESTVLDFTNLREMERLVGPGLIEELLRIFAQDLRHGPDQIAGLVQARDWQGAAHLAHSIKGAAANVGARLVYAAIRELEASLRDHAPANDIRAITQSVEVMREACRRTMVEITSPAG